MKDFTNHALGARGVNLSDGTTTWIEPGQTVSLDPKLIVGDLPDLGEPAPAAKKGAADKVEALRAQVKDLAAQVSALTADKAELTKQVETLTKPPAK